MSNDLRDELLRKVLEMADCNESIASHPSDEELAMLAARQVDDSAREALLCHLAECDECRETVAALLKLDETVAVIADASLLIGVDTGLTHMGTALRIPTVALFGSTRPYRDARSARTVILYEQLPCSPCRRHPTCDGRFDCMAAHTVAGVLAAAQRVLATP